MKYKYKDIYLDLKKMFYVSGQIIKGGCVCMNLCNFDVRETELKLNGTPIFFFFYNCLNIFLSWTDKVWDNVVTVKLFNKRFCHYLQVFRVYCSSQQQSMCATSF